MKKKEPKKEPYIVPEKARDKLNAAQKIRQTVYIYGASGYGKTQKLFWSYAEQLTGMQNVENLINRAQMTGNFMSEKNGVYTFFPELLLSMRNRIKKEYTKEKLNRLYYNAGRIYVKDNQVLKALEMFELSGDKEQIRDLLIENVRVNPGAGFLYELRKYYLSLSESYIENSMELMAGMSMLQSLLFNIPKSEYWYEELKELEKESRRRKRYNGRMVKKDRMAQVVPDGGGESDLGNGNQHFQARKSWK